MPRWWNWQTRYLEVVVGATPCGFESHSGHKKRSGTWRSWLARVAYIDEVGGSNPSVPTQKRAPQGSFKGTNEFKFFPIFLALFHILFY